MLSTDEPKSPSLMMFRNKLDTFLVGLLYKNTMLRTGGRTAGAERSAAEQPKLLQEKKSLQISELSLSLFTNLLLPQILF